MNGSAGKEGNVRLFCAGSAAFAVLFFLAAPSIFCAGPGSRTVGAVDLAASFPENWQARSLLADLADLSPEEVCALPSRIIGGAAGGPLPVRFAVEEQGGFLYLLFLNERDLAFPQYGTGSYIVKLDGSDLALIQIKVFLRDDPGSFIRIFPQGSRARMDLFLFGKRLYQGIPLPVPLDFFLTEPFSTIRELSGRTVNWDLILPSNPGLGSEDVASGAAALAWMLPLLKDADDGAMESTGRYLRISDGRELPEPGMNCSGFAKWVTDSLFFPRTGRYLAIRELAEKHPEKRGNRWGEQFDSTRDPFFGLDWTRNCAAALLRVDKPGSDVEAADVRTIPFFTYREDVGFPVEDLPLILYFLAVQEPGFIYLGAVNGDFGQSPSLRQYYHIAVFFPWLEPDGSPVLKVFERNVETPLAAFVSRYAGEYVHLVRLRAGKFSFPPVP
jgi:hypothetical protein